MPSDNVSREDAKRAMLKVDAGQFDAPTVDQFIAALDALPAAEDGGWEKLREWLEMGAKAQLTCTISGQCYSWAYARVLEAMDHIAASPAALKSEKPDGDKPPHPPEICDGSGKQVMGPLLLPPAAGEGAER